MMALLLCIPNSPSRERRRTTASATSRSGKERERATSYRTSAAAVLLLLLLLLLYRLSSLNSAALLLLSPISSLPRRQMVAQRLVMSSGLLKLMTPFKGFGVVSRRRRLIRPIESQERERREFPLGRRLNEFQQSPSPSQDRPLNCSSRRSFFFLLLSFQTSTFGFNLFTRFLLLRGYFIFSRCFASPFKEPARGWSSPKTLTRHLSDCMPIFSIRKTRTSCCCSLLSLRLSLYTHTYFVYISCV